MRGAMLSWALLMGLLLGCATLHQASQRLVYCIAAQLRTLRELLCSLLSDTFVIRG